MRYSKKERIKIQKKGKKVKKSVIKAQTTNSGGGSRQRGLEIIICIVMLVVCPGFAMIVI